MSGVLRSLQPRVMLKYVEQGDYLAMDSVWLQIGVVVLLVLTIGVLSASKLPVVPARRCRQVLQRVLGWLCIAAGLIGLILPGPGMLLIGIGGALLRGHDPVLHRMIVLLKLRLRAWARQPGLRGWLGTRGQYLLREQRRYMRRARSWFGASVGRTRRAPRGRQSPARHHPRVGRLSAAGHWSHRRRSNAR